MLLQIITSFFFTAEQQSMVRVCIFLISVPNDVIFSHAPTSEALLTVYQKWRKYRLRRHSEFEFWFSH